MSDGKRCVLNQGKMESHDCWEFTPKCATRVEISIFLPLQEEKEVEEEEKKQ